MAEELVAKTVLITGAAKRIGNAAARVLADAGMRLVLHYHRSEDAVQNLAEALRAQHVDVHVLCADLTHPEEAERLMAEAIAHAGPLDALINNASIFPEQTLRDFTPDDLARNINVNALSPFLLGRAFAAQQREGVIISFLDTMIADYDRKHVPYHLSKRMLFSLTRMMAVEFAPLCRANALAPGLILPPEGKDTAYLEALAHTNPLKRYGSTGDICDALLYLMQARFVTGQILFVDGGRHLRGSMYG